MAAVREGLTVRGGPGSAYEEVGATRIAFGSVEMVGAPYLLTAGERLIVQDGPLRVEGADWYSVRPAQWAEPADLVFTEGWVAAGTDGDRYLEASAAPDGSCCFSVAGVGSGATISVPPAPACSPPSACGRAIAWVAGVADPAGTCQLRITQTTTRAVIVEQRIKGWTRGATWWPEDEDSAIVVETECSWSLHIGPL